MRYTVNADSFLELPVTTGTVQNISNTDIEISNEEVVGSGIILKAGETFAWNNATVYACARPVLDGGTGIISVVPFNGKGEGGGGSYTLPAATDSTLGGVIVGSNISVANDGTISVTDTNVKSALGTGSGTTKYLREDGTWETPPNNTYSVATQSADGLMSSTDKTNLDNIELNYRQPSTAYTVGAIAYHTALPAGYYLECTTEGITSSGTISPSSTLDATVSDGTVVWVIRNISDSALTTKGYCSDANSITQGIYYVNGSSINTPATANGSLINLKSAYETQFYIQNYSHGGKMWVRQRGEGWSGWQNIGDSAVVAKSLGINGYIKYASGLIVQYGYFRTDEGGKHTVDFPISFTTTNYSVSGAAIGSATDVNFSVDYQLASSLIMQTNYTIANIPCRWIAIGY